MKTVLSLLALAFLTGPAFACNIQDAEAALSRQSGSSVITTMPVPYSDDVVIILASHNGSLVLVLTKNGCAEIDDNGQLIAHDVGDYVPTTTPQKAPVLHGGGQEIGT